MASKFFCRAFQGIMKIGNNFIDYRMPEYIEGEGSVCRLPELIKCNGIDNVLVVTDNDLVNLGLPDSLLEALTEAGIKNTVYSDIERNPTSDDVERGVTIYRDNGCKAIVAFGGGTPMDCAKAIGARIARPHRSVRQLQGTLKVGKRIPPLFAVPTTSGTGSETTVAAVITNSYNHHKAAINDPHLIPKYAVLDPLLTKGLPPFVTATTGMDALCHAVEAYTNHTYNTELEDKLAIEAVQLVHGNLLRAYNNGDDLEARQNMQKAAFYAGRAFTRGCVGYVHAVGHTLGGLYGVAHGLAMAVILPYVMRQYGSEVYDRLAVLADACNMGGETNEEKAKLFIDWIEKMNAEMGIPTGFDMITNKDVPQMIEWADTEANPLYPVPVIWQPVDFAKLIEKIRK